ncbi:MAG TPA: TIGR03621 family F420-dependent LLM class oxidoreductase, partial [Thermomicrobiales bacterium]|nr:TIGR03621 family F420-dependent LLM class oxidoreductase [Thermomicrobiales bacterium]
IGTLVISNDFRPPLILAKEIATLDVISGGRIELGLGAGFLEPEYATLGIPFDAPGVRVARLEEATVLLRGLFSGEPVTFHGKHYTVDGFATYPRPVQGDHLPILVAGSGDRMLRMAARRADIVGLQAAGTSSSRMDDPTGRLAASVARKIDLIRSAAGERFPQIELNTTVVVEICEDREARAREIIEARGWTNLGAGDVLQMPSLLIGTLAEISEQLRRQRDELALSYLVVSQAQAPLLAPMVKNLSGT